MIVVVCGPESYFADDESARCAACDAAIVHRPHVPPTATLLCHPCATVLMAIEPNVRVGITAESLREYLLYKAQTERPS